MKKLNSTLLVLVPILLLCGCYESLVPLSESPSSKVDPRLIRNWISIPDVNNKKSISLQLRKFTEKEYLVAWKEGKDGNTVIARGYDTRINTTNIANLQNIEPLEGKERTYVFMKHGFNEKGNLVVNILSDEFADLKKREFDSSKDFRDFVRKNLNQNGLFRNSIEFRSAKEASFEISL